MEAWGLLPLRVPGSDQVPEAEERDIVLTTSERGGASWSNGYGLTRFVVAREVVELRRGDGGEGEERKGINGGGDNECNRWRWIPFNARVISVQGTVP